MWIMTVWSAAFLVALSICFGEVSGGKHGNDDADFGPNDVPLPSSSSLAPSSMQSSTAGTRVSGYAVPQGMLPAVTQKKVTRGITVEQMNNPEELFKIFETAVRKNDGEMAMLSCRLLVAGPDIPSKFKSCALLCQVGQRAQAREIFKTVAAMSDCKMSQDYALECLGQLNKGQGLKSTIDLFGK